MSNSVGIAFISKAYYIVVVDLPLLRVAVDGSDNLIISEQPCRAYLPPDQQRHHSLGPVCCLRYIGVCSCESVVCGCVLHRGQRGEVGCVSSTLCSYDIRMGLLLVRSWAMVRRVSLGRESSEGEILGAC